jgi:hypothetical protein
MVSFRTALLATAASALSLAATPAALANPLTFTNYTTANGLGNNSVRGVYASGSSIYAATSAGNGGGGLSISTNGGTSFTNYTIANGLGDNDVQGVYASGSSSLRLLPQTAPPAACRCHRLPLLLIPCGRISADHLATPSVAAAGPPMDASPRSPHRLRPPQPMAGLGLGGPGAELASRQRHSPGPGTTGVVAADL